MSRFRRRPAGNNRAVRRARQVGKQSGDYAGDAQLVNSVYLDNSSLELYHGRLDKRPNAIAVRIRWVAGGRGWWRGGWVAGGQG